MYKISVYIYIYQLTIDQNNVEHNYQIKNVHS